jgi:hypothetical protein
MDAGIVIFTFAALIVAAALFVRLRLGTALRDGRIPDPPPGRCMLSLELVVLVFLCLLIPRLLPRPEPRPGTAGIRNAHSPTHEGPPDTEAARRQSVAERHDDETGGDG